MLPDETLPERFQSREAFNEACSSEVRVLSRLEVAAAEEIYDRLADSLDDAAWGCWPYNYFAVLVDSLREERAA